MRRRKQKGDEPDLVLRDGALVLTFVNTGSRRSKALQDYGDLLAWADEHGALRDADTQRLRRLATERGDDAKAVFAAAKELHGVLSRIVSAIVGRQEPPAEAVDSLNALLTAAAPRRILVPTRTRLDWTWPEDPPRILFRPLWLVAQSAMDLLTSETCKRVRRCAAEGCNVVFITRGPGMPRKFCSTKSCGNPARAREYYLRVTRHR